MFDFFKKVLDRKAAGKDSLAVDDDVVMSFLFAVYAGLNSKLVDVDKGFVHVGQSELHRFVEMGFASVKKQVESLDLPIIIGRVGNVSSNGHTFVYLDKPDFGEHKALFTAGSLCVLEKHVKRLPETGEFAFTGFEAKVRVGASNLWFCVGIRDIGTEEDYTENDDLYNEDSEFIEHQEKIDWRAINKVAVAVARSPGFGNVVRSPDMRVDFALPFIEKLMPEADPEAVVRQAVTFWEFGVIPQRAKKLKADGKKIAEIAKLLGITRQRAERAADMDDQQLDNLMNEHGEE
ncbi:MAG: hypothetical protein LBO00_10275 [Zoogloeaceae bacterium]|nr:hypothetical protein [Zoogloeaceae bacterium]